MDKYPPSYPLRYPQLLPTRDRRALNSGEECGGEAGNSMSLLSSDAIRHRKLLFWSLKLIGTMETKALLQDFHELPDLRKISFKLGGRGLRNQRLRVRPPGAAGGERRSPGGVANS